MDTEQLDKKYYKIKDVSELIGVPQSTVRYWETEFPALSPRRSASNRRYYTPDDIELLRIIYFLVKVRGLKIDAAKEQLRVNRKNISRRMEVIERLENVRGQLEELRKALNIRK